ncbi:MAG: N-acetylglucosamine-6-phosphate deacetylase [bacterium]|nr:N-acetylglucosamine-6-phosphate deacetylase [bacterium]
MSQTRFLHNLELLDPEAAAPRDAAVLVEGGRIAAVLPRDARAPHGAEALDLQGAALAPGFIDLHFHGELIFARGPALCGALERAATSLSRAGTTAFLATTAAWDDARIKDFLTQCRGHMTQPRQGAAELLGAHLEGPWINAAAAGAQPRRPIRPYDAANDAEILTFGQDLVRMVTLAPEVDGALDLVEALKSRGMVASLGHSLARHDEIDACVKAGMTHATHLFNAMGALHHRDPGTAGWVLADDRLTCDLVCDGIHVHPAMVQTACRAKGERLLLISDRIEPPRGSDPQASSFGSGPIHDDGSAIRMADGSLAGSSLTLDRALRCAQAFGAMSRTEAIASVTLRPARLLGIEAQRGTLRVGARADFAVLDAEDRIRETWIAGERAFQDR